MAYDGRAFHGWQSQLGGQTVQDVIEAALSKVSGTTMRLHGAGRTDAGVHACGQCAHFDSIETARLSPSDWLRALNTYLPVEIRVISVRKVSPQFHARFSARGKHYRYIINTHQVLSPFLSERVYHFPYALDFDLLHAAIH